MKINFSLLMSPGEKETQQLQRKEQQCNEENVYRTAQLQHAILVRTSLNLLKQTSSYNLASNPALLNTSYS
jgi:hypothetical protein